MTGEMKDTRRLIYLGVALGVFYWIVEAVVDGYAFHEGTFARSLFLPDPHEFYMRLMVTGCIIAFAVYAHRMFGETHRIQGELNRYRREYERAATSHIVELTDINRRLKAEISEREKTEIAIVSAKEDWERTFDSVPDLIAVMDLQHNIVRMNKAMTERFGPIPRGVLAMPCHKCFHGSEEPLDTCPYETMRRDTREHSVELFEESLDSWFLVTVTPLFDPEGQLAGAIHIARDITDKRRMEDELRRTRDELEMRVKERTVELAVANERLRREVEERKRAAEALLESERFLQSAMDALSAHIAILDDSGRIVSVNRAWCRFGEENGFRGEAFGLGMNYLGVCESASGKYSEEAAAVARGIRKVLTREADRFEIEYFCPDPAEDQWFAAIVTRFEKQDPVRVVVVHENISERKRAEAQLLHDAFHDSLTGLPNRALFLDRLKQAALRARRNRKRSFAVLFLDLDHFKYVNDSLGHLAGDLLLSDIVRRIQSCVRSNDTMARLGGDEFTILLDEIPDASEAVRLAERIQRALSEPFTLNGEDVFATASIGIALGDAALDRPEDLLRDADTAMYRAKSLGRARHQVFDPEMHTRAVTRLQTETDLRKAVENDEFLVYYQPIVSLASGRLSGFEALVRWRHPQRGIVPPGEFIPLAEETGLIVAIGTGVLYEACRQMKEWHASFPDLAPPAISVNVSGRQFAPADLMERVEGILKETGLNPGALKLEITESVIMENADSIIDTLGQLKTMGIRLSIDDFGTGYSSLSYLHRFPVDTLKIDRSFVKDMLDCGDHRAIVTTIVSLAHNLGISVIAEGTETREEVEVLRALGCEYAQGYYFAKPMDAKATERYILAESLLPGESCRVRAVG